MAKTLPGTLRELLGAAGPSGYETAPAAAWREAAQAFGADVGGDALGSSTARVTGRAGDLRLAVVGHIDEIGLIVTHIDDEGFLWFRPVGGWDAQILVAQRVRVATREGSLPGVIGKKPVHLLREEERKKVPEIRELHIDIGARDGEQARSMVRVGDVAVIDAEPIELPNRRLASRALDNRLGAYVALEAARLVAEADGAWSRWRRFRRRSPSPGRGPASTRSSPPWPSPSTSLTRPTLPESTSRTAASTSSGRVR
jgi:endoglucanase